MNWALRVQEGKTGLIQSVDRVISEADPLLPITIFRTMDEIIGLSLAATRFRTLLLSLFAAAAVTLAGDGHALLLAADVPPTCSLTGAGEMLSLERDAPSQCSH